jgi:hypothetical protein
MGVSMNKPLRLLAPLAVAAITAATPMGLAQADSGEMYQATLNPLNNSTGSGMLTLTLNGNMATVEESFSGLAAEFDGAPYPHVQHIHIGAKGTCPTQMADKDGDGVVNTTEGEPSYGPIGTTLSTSGDTSPAAGTNLEVALAGASANYSRTFELNADTMASVQDGTAVIVVHGLDPATLSQEAQEAPSDLVPSLPLAATSPALCGPLTAMPAGGAATGYGSTSGPESLGLLGLGGGLLTLAVGGALYARKRGGVNAELQS